TTISNNLATTNVTLQTNADGTTSGQGATSAGLGDIILNAPISWSSANTLTLNAYHSIIINPDVIITNVGSGSLTLRADSTGTGQGTVNFLGAIGENAARIDFSQSTGLVSIYYNPVPESGKLHKYQNEADYSPWVTTS